MFKGTNLPAWIYALHTTLISGIKHQSINQSINTNENWTYIYLTYQKFTPFLQEREICLGQISTWMIQLEYRVVMYGPWRTVKFNVYIYVAVSTCCLFIQILQKHFRKISDMIWHIIWRKELRTVRYVWLNDYCCSENWNNGGLILLLTIFQLYHRSPIDNPLKRQLFFWKRDIWYSLRSTLIRRETSKYSEIQCTYNVPL